MTTELDQPYTLAGRGCYGIGWCDGFFPDFGWHKTKEMGGIWMHPLKIADGVWLSVDDAGWPPQESYNAIRREWCKKNDEFVLGEGGAWSEHIYYKGNWTITRRQFVPKDDQAFGVEFDIKTSSPEVQKVRLSVLVRFDVQTTWMSGWDDPVGLEVEAIENGAVAHGISGSDLPYDWGYFTGAVKFDKKPERLAIGEELWGPERTYGNGTSVLATFYLDLDPQAKVRMVLTGNHMGEIKPLATADDVLANWDAKLKEKVDFYRHIASELTCVETPEPLLNDAYRWSKLNVEWMTQHSECLGTCVTAGHQDFTCYFGGDTFLSIRGILASGLHETAKDSLRVIGGIAERQDGKAPHEFSSTGNVYDPGSVGETPLFMRVVWDTYLWTGDENFLKELYPTLKKGMWDYIESEPVANGVLMGEIEDHPGGAREKINPIQLAGGYKIFADMCERLGDIEDAKRARAESDRYLKQVEELFWVEEEGSYTDIIDENNKPLIDKNNLMWGRPFQGVGYIGISPKERVVRSLAKFKGPKYESEYGVFLGGNNCNMPVQTGFAAIAEFNYDRNEEGLEYVRCLARTCGHASPGAFPEGMDPYGDRKKMRYFKSSHWNYLQLWSSAFMPESLVWGLLKLRPDAANRKITLKPWLPENWPFMEFRNIRIGQSRFNVRVDKSGTKVTQVDGPKLEVNIIE
jgi:hypothetical protein